MKKTRKNKFGNRPKGRFRSELEAYTAKLLDEEGIGYKYEEVMYPLIRTDPDPGVVLVKKVRGVFAARPARILGSYYIPDFVDTHHSPKWMIEVKGMETPEFKLKFKLFIQRLSRNTDVTPPTIYMPKNKAEVRTTVNMIKHWTNAKGNS